MKLGTNYTSKYDSVITDVTFNETLVLFYNTFKRSLSLVTWVALVVE